MQQKISELTLEAVGYFGLLKSNESQTEKTNEYFPGPEYATNAGADYLKFKKNNYLWWFK